MFKKIILGTVCALTISTSAFAGLEEGLDYFNRKKYEQAYDEFSYLAEEGNNVATYYMGLMYQNGLAVPKSMEKAASYYMQAFKLGNTAAAGQLGLLLLAGEGVRQDAETGLNLLKTAARTGDKESLYQLGEIYAKGEVVPMEYVHAAGFYKMAAVQGYAPAQYRYGLLHLYGRGVPQDFSMATQWLKRAANQGYVKAQYDLAELYANEMRLKNPMNAYMWYSIVAAYNTDEIGSMASSKRDEQSALIQDINNFQVAQQMTRDWKVQTPQDTVPESEKMQPLPIIPGFNDEETLQKLQEENQIIISDGSAYGIMADELEQAILSGKTADVELKATNAAKSGKTDAYLYWAKILENRLQNPVRAFEWFLKGAQAGDVEAQYRVAQGYCEGKVTTFNPTECYMWLLIASEKAVNPMKEIIMQTLGPVEAQLKPEEIADGKQKADAFLGKGNAASGQKEKKDAFSLF